MHVMLSLCFTVEVEKYRSQVSERVSVGEQAQATPL